MKTIQLVENGKYVSLLAVNAVLRLKGKDFDSESPILITAINKEDPVKMSVVNLKTGTHYVIPAERFERDFVCLGIDLTKVEDEEDPVDNAVESIRDAFKELTDALNSYKDQLMSAKVGENKQVSDVVNEAEEKIKDCVKQGKEYIQSGKAREDLAGTVEKSSKVICDTLKVLADAIRKDNK